MIQPIKAADLSHTDLGHLEMTMKGTKDVWTYIGQTRDGEVLLQDSENNIKAYPKLEFDLRKFHKPFDR